MNGNQAGSENVQPEKDTLQADQCLGRTVQEVHIDFLLEEEFSVGLDFLQHFIEGAGYQGTPFEPVRVERSVWDDFGEADLIVVYKQNDGKSVAILIEDKVRAGFQQNQSARYCDRGKHGGSGKGLKWDKYWTCLVAPLSYVESKPEHGFDKAVTLQQIEGWLAVTDPERHEFKVGVIDQAIKTPPTGVQKVDPVMTAFRISYYTFFEGFFADRRDGVWMRPPWPTYKGDSWFEIRSPRARAHPLLPHGVYINHKSQAGFVDLTFPHTSAKLLKPIEPWLEPDQYCPANAQSAGGN